MTFSTNSTSKVLDPKTAKRKYPEARIIVLDDNINTFEHVANCLVIIIPGMSKKYRGILPLKWIEKDLQKYGEDLLNKPSYIISSLNAKA